MNRSPVPSGDRELAKLLSIAVPLAFAQVGQMVMGVTDAIWMGHLNTDALAAGGLGSSFAFMMLVVVSGLLQSLQPIVAQGRGAGDHSGFGRALAGGFVIALLSSVPVILVLLSARTLLVAAGDPAPIATMTQRYEAALVWGVPAWFWQTTLRNYLAALDRTRIIMVVLLVGCMVNFGLNWALIFGHLGLPVLGLRGSGYATAIVFWGMALALSLYVVWLRLLPPGMFRLTYRDIRRGMGELAVIGWPIAGVLAVEIGLFSGSAVLMGRFGPVALAAHQICIGVASLTFMVPLAIGTAASVRVGFHIGAGRPALARHAGFLAIGLALAFMSAAAIAMWSCATAIFRLYLSDADPLLPAVTALGTTLIGVAALFQVFDGIQTVAAGALRGLRDTRAALAAGIVGYWVLGGPIGIFLAFRGGFGPIGMWWGFTVGLIAMALLLSLRFIDLTRQLMAVRPRWIDASA